MNKIWVRVLVSLFAGGMTSEIIHISTGDADRPETTNFTLLYALVIFLILNIYMKLYKNKEENKTL